METGTAPEMRYCGECGRPSPIDELAHFGDHLVCQDCKNSYAQKLREGVTPAGAGATQFEYGGFWIRALASILDSMILAVANYILQLVVWRPLLPSSQIHPGVPPVEILRAMWGAAGIAALVNMAINCCYEAFFVAKLGATPGKMALGLKVVRPDGGPVDLGRAFGRYFAKILSTMILGIGYIMAGFDSEKRALHDMICGTRVVKLSETISLSLS
jgi:uncharacterized RDD family membrane protein YckC